MGYSVSDQPGGAQLRSCAPHSRPRKLPGLPQRGSDWKAGVRERGVQHALCTPQCRQPPCDSHAQPEAPGLVTLALWILSLWDLCQTGVPFLGLVSEGDLLG